MKVNSPPNNLDEVFEISPIAMVRFDAQGHPISMNPAARELLASINIQPEAISTILTSRQRSLLRHTLRDRTIAETDLIQNARNLHLIFKCAKDGSAYLFLIDLTAQEKAKAQLIQSEKMASLGLLVAGLAHEINTPLGAIHSNNDTLSKSLEKMKGIFEAHSELASEERNQSASHLAGIMSEVCRNMSLATERLIAIVGSLKNFARLDEAEFQKANIHEGIDSTLTIVQHQFKNRINVEKHYGVIPLVECHPNGINQVFMNILVNAGQAIPDRGTITITTSARDGLVRIAISDTGTGIPEGNLPKVFDPGFTTKGVGVGTGLGLSICYRIIQEHQGTIEVESGKQGTTFTIVLPIRGMGRKVKRGGSEASSDLARRR